MYPITTDLNRARTLQQLLQSSAGGRRYGPRSGPAGRLGPVVVELLADIAAGDSTQHDAALMTLTGHHWTDTMQNVTIRNVTQYSLRQGERLIARPTSNLGLCIQGRFPAATSYSSGQLGSPIPACFGCPNVLSTASFANIRVEMDQLSWTMPATDSCTETYTTGGPPITYTNEHYTRSRNVNLIGPSNTLRRKPDNRCEWLWNDIRVVQTVWHDGADATHGAVRDEIAEYEPLNATDATSPWNRVTTAITDARCGTCIIASPCGTGPTERWQCSSPQYGNSVQAFVAAGPISGTEYTATPTGPMWWVVWVQTNLHRSGTSVQGLGGVFSYATPGQVSWKGWYDNSDLSTGVTSCPPYRWDGFDLNTFFAPGAVVLQYAKPVNCSTDFNGNPIVIPINTLYQNRATAADITYPSEVRILL